MLRPGEPYKGEVKRRDSNFLGGRGKRKPGHRLQYPFSRPEKGEPGQSFSLLALAADSPLSAGLRKAARGQCAPTETCELTVSGSCSPERAKPPGKCKGKCFHSSDETGCVKMNNKAGPGPTSRPGCSANLALVEGRRGGYTLVSSPSKRPILSTFLSIVA